MGFMNKKTLPVLMTCWQRKGGNEPPTVVSLDNGRLDPTAEVSVHLPSSQEKRVLEARSCLPQAELRKDLHKWLSRFCQHRAKTRSSHCFLLDGYSPMLGLEKSLPFSHMAGDFHGPIGIWQREHSFPWPDVAVEGGVSVWRRWGAFRTLFSFGPC